CSRASVDDHGDTFSCATVLALGQDVKARLHHPLSDDADVFTFSMTRFGTVDILTEGPGIRGALYDDAGHRLALDAGWDGRGSRIVRALDPGRYFLRLENARPGNGAGDYRLTVSEYRGN
ncbi:MAG: hypothetical protein AAGD06_32245, partial [Acidobacteriota bacterium]